MLPILLGVVDSFPIQSNETSEDSYDYGIVLASSRSQGIDFWGRLPAQSARCRSSCLTVFQVTSPSPADELTLLMQTCLGLLAAYMQRIMPL